MAQPPRANDFYEDDEDVDELLAIHEDARPVTTDTPTSGGAGDLAAGIAIVLIMVIVVGYLLFFQDYGGGDDGGSRARPDPCSDQVMNAPYETGSEYLHRDQAAERMQACLKYQADNFNG